MRNADVVAALDVGASVVRALVVRRAETGLEVLGYGEAHHSGAPKGLVSKVDEVTAAVAKAVQEAEVMAGVPMERVVVGIGGPSIMGFSATSSIPISGGMISAADRRRVLDGCTRFTVPDEYRMVAVHPREFVVDGQPGIKDPVGLSASRLEARAYVLFAHKTHLETLTRCVNHASVAIDRVYFEPVAAARGAATEEEMELGCLVVDVGFGTTEWALVAEGSVVAAGAVPVGGRNFTNDLVVVFHTTSHAAEELKRRIGVVGSEESRIELPVLGTGKQAAYPTQMLTDVLRARAKELFVGIMNAVEREAGDSSPRAGVVLTGGGAALPGLDEMARNIFGARCRLGRPLGLIGDHEPVLRPEWAVACGLAVLHAADGDEVYPAKSGRTSFGAAIRGVLGRLFDMGGGK